MAAIDDDKIEIARLEGKTHLDSKGPIFWLGAGLLLTIIYALIQIAAGDMVRLMTWGVMWTGWNVLWGACLISYTRTNYTVYRDRNPR